MASSLGRIATCNLNQWALDFDGNLERVVTSIRRAKQEGARFRLGPELEIPGYGCEDHFLELDTYVHSWECLGELMETDATDDILCDIGIPVVHRDVTYNCRIYLLNRVILGIKPKLYLANDGNYRETRWFTEWSNDQSIEDFQIPQIILAKFPGHARTVPIGNFVLRLRDTVIGSETCEELFTPDAPHIKMCLDGVEIIANGSGSHHQLRKLSKRIDLIRGATAKSGGIYMYANQIGCDGGRLYYDGCCCIWQNGECIAQGSQFSMREVEVRTAVVNLSASHMYRASFKSRSKQAADTTVKYPRVDVDFFLCRPDSTDTNASVPFAPWLPDPMEEIAYGPSTWLWDYLRRSGMRGYFLPLSGGADSSSTASMVGFMCERLMNEIQLGGPDAERILKELRRLTRQPNFQPVSAAAICKNLFWTCYMASEFSGDETRRRARELCKLIGANHSSILIDQITEAVKNTFKEMKIHDDPVADQRERRKPEITGSNSENIALQNIQARTRMVMAYFLAQMMPWQMDPSQQFPGSLLVLGSANVDEALRGYYTKYDCSAADINPIGGIKKVDLKAFLLWADEKLCNAKDNRVLRDVANAEPSAELTGSEGNQKDEDDMGMSYAELNDLGNARKIAQCGPLSTFEKILETWDPTGLARNPSQSCNGTGTSSSSSGTRKTITPSKRLRQDESAAFSYPAQVGQKVKDFYFYYAINRHKMTTLTPSYHAENYSPEDNRFDLRPFLYPASFSRQFRAIDEAVKVAEKRRKLAPVEDGA